jgi:histidinol-phosphatase
MDSPDDLAADLALALRLADAADAVTLPRFRAADLQVTTKPDRSPVTDADTAAEEVVRALIAVERPGDAVLGEEGGGSVAGAGRGWVLDPIDGTKNFSRGMPAWATLIALTVDGTATVGVASAPALGRRWWGAIGRGAWTSDTPGAVPRRMAVSKVATLGDAYLSTTDLRVFGQQGRMDRWLALVDAVWETVPDAVVDPRAAQAARTLRRTGRALVLACNTQRPIAYRRRTLATAGGLVNGKKLVVITAFNETITCAATYSNYRRFETSARIVPPK